MAVVILKWITLNFIELKVKLLKSKNRYFDKSLYIFHNNFFNVKNLASWKWTTLDPDISGSVHYLFNIYIKAFGIHTFSFRSNLISKKSLIWFIMISPAKFQTPNPSIKATNGIPRFWSFGRFVWKSKKLPNFFIFDKLFTFLFWIS